MRERRGRFGADRNAARKPFAEIGHAISQRRKRQRKLSARVEPLGGARGHLFGNDDVGAQRQVRPMRFGRANWKNQSAKPRLFQQIAKFSPGASSKEMIGHKI